MLKKTLTFGNPLEKSTIVLYTKFIRKNMNGRALPSLAIQFSFPAVEYFPYHFSVFSAEKDGEGPSSRNEAIARAQAAAAGALTENEEHGSAEMELVTQQ